MSEQSSQGPDLGGRSRVGGGCRPRRNPRVLLRAPASEVAPDLVDESGQHHGAATTTCRTREAAAAAAEAAAARAAAAAADGATSLGRDPGPRAGAAAAGSFYPDASMPTSRRSSRASAWARFEEVDSVSGTLKGEVRLGPRAHVQRQLVRDVPCAAGDAEGAAPGMTSPQNPIPNPQVALATLDGATNTVPSFITAAGPVREAQVHRATAASTASSRSRAARTRPAARSRSRTSPRRSSRQRHLPHSDADSSGSGWWRATPDATLQANLRRTSRRTPSSASAGVLNTSGNDGTITRFGWKAQNKSLLIFAGEAYNVEQGVSNEVFHERALRGEPAACSTARPEDSTGIVNGESTTGTASDMSSDTVNFAAFMRLSAPPDAGDASTSAAQNGREPLHVASAAASCHSRVADDGGRRRSRGCRTSPTTRTPTSRFITWGRTWPTGSRRAARARTSSGPRRSGASDSGCSSCTTAARRTWGRPSRRTSSSGTSCVSTVGRQLQQELTARSPRAASSNPARPKPTP